MEALRNFVVNGNRVIFIIGNHDMELHWMAVRRDIVDFLNLPVKLQSNVRFCEWFYISESDTLIEHGNQYDPYCLCANPINPLIRKRKKDFIRLPFGNLANKYMINGMGLKNPHDDRNFIMSVFEFSKYFGECFPK